MKINKKALESLKDNAGKFRKSLVPIIAGVVIALGSSYIAKQAIDKYKEVFDARDVYKGLLAKKETLGNICQYVTETQHDLIGEPASISYSGKHIYLRGAKKSLDNAIDTIGREELSEDFENEFLEMAKGIRENLDNSNTEGMKYARGNIENLSGIANKEFNSVSDAYEEMGKDTSYIAPEISYLGFLASSVFALGGCGLALYGAPDGLSSTRGMGRSLKKIISEDDIENMS